MSGIETTKPLYCATTIRETRTNKILSKALLDLVFDRVASSRVPVLSVCLFVGQKSRSASLEELSTEQTSQGQLRSSASIDGLDSHSKSSADLLDDSSKSSKK